MYIHIYTYTLNIYIYIPHSNPTQFILSKIKKYLSSSCVIFQPVYGEFRA